ncbi:MAG: S-formylglutathione hydrolase [Lysobacterales bacterium]|jgi:S-formylglutathione hydrolase
MQQISSVTCFGGEIRRLSHRSESCGCDMTFGVFLPPQAKQGPVPALMWLSGLTCTDENFMIKAGAQRVAAELGLAIVCPDTSPRGTDFPGEHDDYDFGSGAGFYVNATQAPWSANYRMYDYVTQELPALAEADLPLNGRWAISGHSMGGHGALVCCLKNPGKYLSVSAFAPICNPSNCGWGRKAFGNYLGDDRSDWAEYDASVLIGDAREKLPILIDQGTDDEWLSDQLKPGSLEQGAICSHYPLQLRMQEGYDHSYFFVATFIEEHLRHHARALL